MSSFFINFQLVLYLSFISLYVYHECQHAPLRILLIHSNQFYIFWRTSQKMKGYFFLLQKDRLIQYLQYIGWMERRKGRKERKLKFRIERKIEEFFFLFLFLDVNFSYFSFNFLPQLNRRKNITFIQRKKIHCYVFSFLYPIKHTIN